MRSVPIGLCLLVFGLTVAVPVERASAALTSDQKRELSDLWRDAKKVNALIRRKRTDEAETTLADVEMRLQKLIQDAMLEPGDRVVAGLQKFLARQRKLLEGQKGGDEKSDEGVSFVDDVAPILNARCLGCHADNPRANRRLDTFAGMKRPGAGGPLLVPGRPDRSLLMARLLAPANQRMPRNAAPLSQKEIQTIALWIAQGARFDGDGEDIPLGRLKRKGEDEEPIVIPKPTGNETVSFVKDIAPFMVVHCLRCHGENNPRSGFSIYNFEAIMKGGDSGRVVEPGDLDASRLWDLVGLQDPIKMPQGQGRITVENHSDLRTWLLEGAKYDGDDPKTPLRELVPTEEDKRREMLANFSAEEFAEHREKQTEAIWKRVTKEPAEFERSEEFYVYGNVPAGRLKQIAEWAEEYAQELRATFEEKDDLLWKGRLAIFVFRDRFGYEEFHQTIHRRRVPSGVTGHSVVDPMFDNAYIVLQDVGDEPDEVSAGLRVNLIDHLTGAFLKRSGGGLPEWVVRGTGLALAASTDRGNTYLKSLDEAALVALRNVERPEDVFANGTFSPAQIGPVGYTLVGFLLESGGGGRFAQFIKRLQAGDEVEDAFKRVYRAEMRAIAVSYAAALNKQVRN